MSILTICTCAFLLLLPDAIALMHGYPFACKLLTSHEGMARLPREKVRLRWTELWDVVCVGARYEGTGWERRFSDSHMRAFQRDGVLPLRRIFDPQALQPDMQASSARDVLVGVGGLLACRLLEAPSAFFCPSQVVPQFDNFGTQFGKEIKILGLLIPLQDVEEQECPYFVPHGNKPLAAPEADLYLKSGDCLAFMNQRGSWVHRKVPCGAAFLQVHPWQQRPRKCTHDSLFCKHLSAH